MVSEDGDDKSSDVLPKWVKNDRLGDDWVLVRRIHKSYVWQVRSVVVLPRQPPQYAVAKRMKNNDASGGSRKRFHGEVKGLEALGKIRGVVPLIDREPGDEPRWFIMEKALPLAECVKGQSFRSLVKVFADLADTLHQLRFTDQQVSHRDIKPDNLFWLNQTPAFGDFGIAGWTDRAEITQEINKLGPYTYIAPEALRPHHNANWYAADVYSLMKTMWALAEYQYEHLLALETGAPPPSQIFPPPQGEINATNEWAYSFRRFFGPEGKYLDTLLQDATSNDPARRPTAGDIRNEFRAWLRLTKGVEAKPSPRSNYGTLVNRVERFEKAREQFLETLKREIATEFPQVTFDSSVSTEWRLDPELQYDDPVILADHGRDVIVDSDYEGQPPDDPWEGALLLQLLSPSGGPRVIIGGVLEGTADRPVIDLLAEVHRPQSVGGWKLVKPWDRGDINAGGAVVVETLGKILREVVAALRRDTSTEWTCSRVF
ncbi:hypothetical protein R4P64_32065 [Rhodococcus sp. IEGM 1366]|uniref:protein kinase domain-containing protein n=1 Tax=Rhodococcus sp. IEGM 1366 TaxID=3082223 RepID=UPI002953B89F|nr:protein kinase [Rhodococcus sp. IEGM 1366]MDV8071155.1 hypothetical protein [Rhodococcus sp. IEGM 1366]